MRALLEPPTPKNSTPTRPSISRGPTTSQYYFVLQSLHKALPSITLYYKACTNYLPLLLCTTKLAQSTSQYYFVLQLAQSISQYYFVLPSLHKVFPSTTLYYQACTKYFPVLLCTTKLAQSIFQYYCVLPVVPARGGAEVALGIYYKTFLIYRTCMRRAPARLVRACFVRR